MSEDYIESLARAYNQKLKGSVDPVKEAVVDLINEQIYLLSRLKGCKLVSYLISLKECTKGLIIGEEKPSPRVLPREGGIGKILSLELELFALLDGESGEPYSKILDYENRFIALLAFLK